MIFSKLKVNNWRQFQDVDIEFHPNITIITGANGAGKSTLLRVLSQHFGWPSIMLSTPKKNTSNKSKFFSYFDGLFRKSIENNNGQDSNVVGELQYSDGSISKIISPKQESPTFHLQIQNQKSVVGLIIDSHRDTQQYQAVTNIPLDAISAQKAYQKYNNGKIHRYQGSHVQFSSVYLMKEALISMATFGAGNEYVEKNTELESLFMDFKQILTKVLPDSIGFLDISIRIPDVVIVTKTGEFMIDASSGGLMSIIDIAWQIFLFSSDKEEFTVVMDEPENHLHPSMQRSLLNNLTVSFPKVQFIVATHSPFVVSSVKDSFVYALKYHEGVVNEDANVTKKVSSLLLDLDNKAGTASEILRDVLDVPVTLPEWAELELESIAKQFNVADLNQEKIDTLKAQLDQAGLGEYFPDAVKIMASNNII